ncbi:MAG TPA: alpha/beta hydrolase-fold protein [Terriglobales bacterium]|nr:alpha/beta hydrolase-fold protein [Terriglobales bacterium]
MVVKFLGSATTDAPPSAAEVRTTDLRKHPKFQSRLLSGERELIVYLPPGYDRQPHHRYPVLYLHDGQNLFDETTAYVPGMDWKVDETAESLITQHAIQPLIIVGIYNAGVHRVDEYTPTKDPKLGGGRADLYGRMLVEEVRTFIDQRYRTLDGAANTGLGGSSLGGLVSLYLGLQYPDVFGKLAVLSPSIWWGNKAIIGMIKKADPRPSLRIWLDMGTKEGSRGLSDVRLLRRTLVGKGWTEGKDLHYEEVAGAVHNEAAWAARVGPVLRFLFPLSSPPETTS